MRGRQRLVMRGLRFRDGPLRLKIRAVLLVASVVPMRLTLAMGFRTIWRGGGTGAADLPVLPRAAGRSPHSAARGMGGIRRRASSRSNRQRVFCCQVSSRAVFSQDSTVARCWRAAFV